MSSDPSDYRQYEQEFIQHVEKLLTDDRLRVDTVRGRRPVTTLIRDVTRSDGFSELTDLMKSEVMNRPDRDLRKRMPVGEEIEVKLSQKRWFVFRKALGRMKVVCVSPWKALLKDQQPPPMSRAELAELLSRNPPQAGTPITMVVMSTSGFAIEAHELTERRTDRTVILVAPIAGGGWKVVGPPETKALADLFDPEAEAEKKRRIREAIEAGRAELGGAGLASDRIAARTQLSPSLVEAELKQYAKEKPGLAARRLDGKMVLFRQSAVATEIGSGGVDMPLIDHIKALFARKGETEKKIAFLAERRAALGQQRDRGYEEIGDLETREADLRKQFGDASGEITKRRVTSQLLQLHKDIERRQQLQGVLNQQINVVSTALHNLELVQQGKAAQLPDGEELAQDAAAAEEMMADLQANNELAESVGGGVQGGLSAEEQALYEELEKATRPASATTASPAKDEAAVTMAPPPVQKAPPAAAPATQRKATPEAG